jgi:hypothetical protein
MVHIVIDGYNYLNRVRSTSVPDGANLEMLRQGLLEKLARYKRDHIAKITVVFDAPGGFFPSRQGASYRGIDVLYSKERETADDVMIGWIRERKAGMVVVTSDRAIIDEAKRAGVAFMTPVALEASLAGGKDGDTEDKEERFIARTKTGNPRKLPKKLRKVAKSISKIKS